MKLKEISFEEGQKFKDCCNLLLVTATDIERNEVRKSLTPIGNEKAVYVVYKKTLTYYIGAYGEYGAVLVKSRMGSGRAGGATLTVRNAIDVWGAKAVVMIGIAFGVDREKQRVGDVLVSEQVILYDLKRVGNSITIFRAEQPSADSLLLNRFSVVDNWFFALSDGQPAKKSICPLLSGEVLIDNKAFRDALLRKFPKAQGGEMEGAGVYASASEENIPWIVVKSICDFADGNKRKNKKANQQIAIRSANSLALKVFSSKFAFIDLNLVLSEHCPQNKSTVPPYGLGKDKTEHYGKKATTQSKINIDLKPETTAGESAKKKPVKAGPEKSEKKEPEKPVIKQPLPPPPTELVPFKNRQGLVGYKNKNNQIVIHCKYLKGHHFSEGLAHVKLGLSDVERQKYMEMNLARKVPIYQIKEQMENLGKWGYIDVYGNTVIKHIYDNAWPFKKNGKAKVKRNGHSYSIDKTGKRLKS